MKRTALYARFSSELQNERSADDQLALCRSYCEKNGFHLVAEFADRAISGASVMGRQGLANMMAAIERHEFDVVVVEAIDRVSRDMGDLSNIWKQMQFNNVELIAVHEGKADQVQIGVRGLVGALYLADLAHKVRRGQAGKLSKGQRAGGLPYGYCAIPGRPGENEINQQEAVVIRRTFAEYAEGKSPRNIAHDLNRDGVKAMDGRQWNASTISGQEKRGAGILRNDIYRGVIVWNKVGKRKNPATGKRVPRINPRSEWKAADAPHLRIVTDDVWQAVQDRLQARALDVRKNQPSPKRLLSGLLRCAVCGSSIVSAGRHHGHPVGICSRYTESGDCTNSRRVRLDKIEDRVVGSLRDHLRDPKAIAEAMSEYQAELRRLSRERHHQRASNERRLTELKQKMERLVDQIADGTLYGPALDTVNRRLTEIGTEISKVEEALQTLPQPDVVELHPSFRDQYLKAVEHLPETMNRIPEAKALLRQLIDHVTVHARQAGDKEVKFNVVGKLDALWGDRWCPRRDLNPHAREGNRF